MTQFREEVVRRGFGSITQEASSPQTVTHQWHSRHKIGSRSKCSSASSDKRSERCSPVGGEAEQGPEGRISSSLNTAQTSERETLPHMGETSSSNSDFVFHAYWAWCVSTECGSGKSPLVSATPLFSWSSKGCLDLKAHRLHSLKVDTLGT